MLLEVLLAIPVPERTTEGPPPTWVEGLSSYLVEGAWRPPVREAGVSAGAVLARLHRAVKAIDPQARVVASDGALDVFDSLAVAEPGEGLEPVPPPWAEGLLGGTAHVQLRSGGLAAAITARFASRARGSAPLLRVVLRAVRADLLPAEGEDPGYPQDLGLALRRKGAFADLRDWLVRDGEQLADQLVSELGDLAARPPERRARVRLLEHGLGVEDLVRGLPAGAARHLVVTGDWFRLLRPAVEVLRHRRGGGVELWRGEVARG